MNKIIWTSYHIEDIPIRYNLKETNIMKLYRTTDLSLKEDNINYLNKYLGELCTMYYVWKNQKRSDYVGFQHYRMLLRNINTHKNILIDNGWFGSILCFFNKGGIQSHILYLGIQYLSKQLNMKSTDIINIAKSNIICFDGNVFMCRWDIFNDICKIVFGFLDYMFPNQSWKNENVLKEYINNMNELFLSNEYIKNDNWYWAQDSCDKNPRYIVYFMEYFIPFYINIKYNKNLNNKYVPKDVEYYDTPNIDNNNVIFKFNDKIIICDFENKNISLEEFTKWYELNTCSGIKEYYILNYINSDVYNQYLKNSILFYKKYKYTNFVEYNDLNNKVLYRKSKYNILYIPINKYIDTISYEYHVNNKYVIKNID